MYTRILTNRAVSRSGYILHNGHEDTHQPGGVKEQLYSAQWTRGYSPTGRCQGAGIFCTMDTRILTNRAVSRSWYILHNGHEGIHQPGGVNELVYSAQWPRGYSPTGRCQGAGIFCTMDTRILTNRAVSRSGYILHNGHEDTHQPGGVKERVYSAQWTRGYSPTGRCQGAGIFCTMDTRILTNRAGSRSWYILHNGYEDTHQQGGVKERVYSAQWTRGYSPTGRCQGAGIFCTMDTRILIIFCTMDTRILTNRAVSRSGYIILHNGHEDTHQPGGVKERVYSAQWTRGYSSYSAQWTRGYSPTGRCQGAGIFCTMDTRILTNRAVSRSGYILHNGHEGTHQQGGVKELLYSAQWTRGYSPTGRCQGAGIFCKMDTRVLTNRAVPRSGYILHNGHEDTHQQGGVNELVYSAQWTRGYSLTGRCQGARIFCTMDKRILTNRAVSRSGYILHNGHEDTHKQGGVNERVYFHNVHEDTDQPGGVKERVYSAQWTRGYSPTGRCQGAGIFCTRDTRILTNRAVSMSGYILHNVHEDTHQPGGVKERVYSAQWTRRYSPTGRGQGAGIFCTIDTRILTNRAVSRSGYILHNGHEDTHQPGGIKERVYSAQWTRG